MASHEENYRGFVIETSITEKPTSWQIDVRVGTRIGDDFVIEPAIPPVSQMFYKPDGALNSAYAMRDDAILKIDEHLATTLEYQVLQAIKEAMPANAEITKERGECFINVSVDWRLDDDPERPNKRSKRIVICVSHEASQDFKGSLQSNKTSVSQRVSRFLSQKLARFNPTHDAHKHELPPVDQWVIESHVING